MDCIIPAHNIRTLSCAIGCLCRISKDLYIEYSPFEGLTLRTINDAKSAYASFEFDPSFFEKCSTTNTLMGPSSKKRRKQRRKNKGMKRGGRRVKKRRDQGQDEEKDEGDKSDEDLDDKYTCRVPVRLVHSILRPRKGVISLRIRSCTSSQRDKQGDDTSFIVPDDNGNDQPVNGIDDEDGSMMQLSFEFHCNEIGIMRITRRIGVEECDSIVAVADKIDCSEIIFAPKTLSRMLDPLCRTTEVALKVDNVLKLVTAASFHNTSSSDNTLLASSKVLNTQTSMGCNEFIQYSWRDDRDTNVSNERQIFSIPLDVNEEVTLVFSIKEVKAILQFCSQVNPDYNLDVTMNFLWGGKPLLFETEGDSFSASLLLATLDHSLVTPMRNVGGATNNATR